MRLRNETGTMGSRQKGKMGNGQKCVGENPSNRGGSCVHACVELSADTFCGVQNMVQETGQASKNREPFREGRFSGAKGRHPCGTIGPLSPRPARTAPPPPAPPAAPAPLGPPGRGGPASSRGGPPPRGTQPQDWTGEGGSRDCRGNFFFRKYIPKIYVMYINICIYVIIIKSKNIKYYLDPFNLRTI